MTKLSDEIEKDRERIDQENKELSSLEQLIFDYPDTEVATNRWGKKRISSERVNSLVTDVEIYHSCGCCHDSPLLVSPYIEVGDLRLYSKPESFWVGTRNSFCQGEIEDKDWKQRLENKNISTTVIKKIEEYFKENKPLYDDELED